MEERIFFDVASLIRDYEGLEKIIEEHKEEWDELERKLRSKEKEKFTKRRLRRLRRKEKWLKFKSALKSFLRKIFTKMLL